MGYALIWVEGLAVALVSLALAAAWAGRGRAARGLWVAAVFLAFAGAAAALALATGSMYVRYGSQLRTPWFFYTLSWLAAFAIAGAILAWRALRRPGPGLARPAAVWPCGTLWLGFGGAVLALGLTLWNMDLAARADLAVFRQEAGAVLLTMTPTPVAESDNAAPLYVQAARELQEPLREPWQDVVWRGLDAQGPADWKDPYVVELVKSREDELALLHKAAARPGCDFNLPRSALDAVTTSGDAVRATVRRGVILLAVDARVQAAQGHLPRAFDDVAAALRMVRHASSQLGLVWALECIAWRALEDALRLAPAGREPLPPLDVPELPPLVRKVREEQTLLGMALPVLASQPSLYTEKVRKDDGPVAAFVSEAVLAPFARLFVVPDELAMVRTSMAQYQQAPRSPRDESPGDWAGLRQWVETEPTSLYGVVYQKPKYHVLLTEGATLTALRQLGRTALAVEANRRKHGRDPVRLEQLVPEFLPALPVDQRDGQPVRLKRFPDMVVLYGTQDGAAVEGGTVRYPERRWPPPLFRLAASQHRDKP